MEIKREIRDAVTDKLAREHRVERMRLYVENYSGMVAETASHIKKEGK